VPVPFALLSVKAWSSPASLAWLLDPAKTYISFTLESYTALWKPTAGAVPLVAIFVQPGVPPIPLANVNTKLSDKALDE
jgi:hypothetical protein